MRIGICTPAVAGSNKGNRITAERWGELLQELGHSVDIFTTALPDPPPDLLLAIHAARSADIVQEFRNRFPHRPIAVAVTGTDVYGNEFKPDTVRRSLRIADRIISLQPATTRDISPEFQAKIRVIRQSAEPPMDRAEPSTATWDVCVSGHLRPVKDPMRCALASRLLPAESRIRIVHIGEALTDADRVAAAQETLENPRYLWLGPLSHPQAIRTLASCKLMVLSSLSEGGPAVIPECLMADVPIISTPTAGTVGMLGDDYPGYFPIGDTSALAVLLRRAETDLDFRRELIESCRRQRPLYERTRERDAWRNLIAELAAGQIPLD